MSTFELYAFAEEFTDTPGGRDRSEGDDSGEQFFQEVLEPRYRAGRKTIFDMRDVYGFATGWLDGAFGEFAYRYGAGTFREYFRIKNDEDPTLLVEVDECLERAESQARREGKR